MTARTDTLRFILGLKLKTLRQDRDLSLVEAAERADLSVSYLSEIEKGRKYPKPDKLIDLAEAFGTSYEDLVSLRVADELNPVKEVFGSPFVQEFPFELFGLRPQDVFGLVTDEPDKAGALIRTFLEIGRTYDVQVEHFLFAALRSYQQMHANYFDALEKDAAAFRAAQDWPAERPIEAATLRAYLEDAHAYTIDAETLPDHATLSGFRSVFVDGDAPRLLLNGDLMPAQQAFIYAREIGYQHLCLGERAATSSWLKVESFEQVLNNFKASYFAGALLMDRRQVEDDMAAFFQREAWDGAALLDLMERHGATPEMFYYRLTELLPRRFGLDEIYFMRFYNEGGTDPFRLTKLLNMSRVAVPHGIGLGEHYCQRWPAMKLLKAFVRQDAADAPSVAAQRSYFLGDDAEFFVLSTARPLALRPGTNSCVSLGFRMTTAFKRAVRFWNDPAIPEAEVNLTCERCPLPLERCQDRVAPPTLHERAQRQQCKEAAVTDLMKTVRAEREA